MARRPQGSVRQRPRLKQGKPKPPGVGRPLPRPKRSKGPAGGPKPKPSTIKPKLGIPPKMPVTRKAMGGEASEGAAKGALRKQRNTDRQKKLMEMLKRLYGTPGPTIRRKPKKFMERPILPKDKPKPKPIRPILPKNFKKPKMKRAK